MANVRFKRAITYIALGATTGLGSLVSTRAWAIDGKPTAAPRAMSAPPSITLTLPELLALPPRQLLAPMALSIAHALLPTSAATEASASEAEHTLSSMRAEPIEDHARARSLGAPLPKQSAQEEQNEVASAAPERSERALTAPEDLALSPGQALAPLKLTWREDAREDQVPNAARAQMAKLEVAQAPAQGKLGKAVLTAAKIESPAEAGQDAFVQAPIPTLTEQAPVALNSGAALPVPEALLPQVDFWKRVYTEVDSSHGFVHDAWHLNVVYNTIAVPAGTRRQSVRGIGQAVSHVATILRNLAHGHRDNPTVEEAHVLAAWPQDVSNATLLEAARNVRFQTGQSDKFKAGLVRSRTWTPFIVSTFTAAGLPRELAALPHVESSFNMHAYSKVRAAGIWQFMPATARLFMHMDSTVDERLDPIRSTESAAHLLAQNYRLLGSWPLAITAYNHGPQGMHRAMHVTGSSDLAVIINKYKNKHFGFASRNFYTELLAAWDVSQHPEKYFGELPLEQPLRYETVTTDAFYHVKSISAALGIDLAVLRAHNPALRPVVWNNSRLIPRGFTLRVPRDLVHGDMLALLGGIPQGERFAHADTAPAKAVRVASHHPMAVASRHSTRRFVAQRGRGAHATRQVARLQAQPNHIKTPVAGPLPWEQKAATQAATHTGAAPGAHTWLE